MGGDISLSDQCLLECSDDLPIGDARVFIEYSWKTVSDYSTPRIANLRSAAVLSLEVGLMWVSSGWIQLAAQCAHRVAVWCQSFQEVLPRWNGWTIGCVIEHKSVAAPVE